MFHGLAQASAASGQCPLVVLWHRLEAVWRCYSPKARMPIPNLENPLDSSPDAPPVRDPMVRLELDDGLAIVTIDRPHARNAISLETMDRLDEALDGAQGARALVIKGAGDKAFVSGGDLKELSAIRTEADAAAMAWRMRSVCDRIAGFSGPVLAALNGHALGGGAEVAVAADIRLAADDIKIGFNQVALEIMPAWGGAERLVKLVGFSKALLLAGTGMILTAQEAQSRGLIDHLIPRESFDTESRKIAKALAHRP